MFEQWEEKDVLVTVRAYPNPSKSSTESSCTAGITRDGRWIRLFPLHWRRLDGHKKFRKYDWIRLRVKKSRDNRPESYYPDVDSIRILRHVSTGHARDWRDRYELLRPLQSASIEKLRTAQRADGTSLGFIRPKRIERLVVEPVDEQWDQEIEEANRQGSLFDRTLPRLETPRYKVSYVFECDDSVCRGHRMMIVDWEVLEAVRKWSKQYHNTWESKFREKFEDYLINQCDLHFFVGTMFKYPDTWIIIGLFYPKK